ncbi:MAG: 2-amino-4-hydroxy-6-hydroxymethyldihydropteridine diphosphokinase [Alphaproteobacteria bacterium]
MILIGLGANLPSCVGEPATTLREALVEFPRRGLKVAKVSPFYRSAAWPDPKDPPFVNAVAIIHTKKSPEAVLRALLDVESVFGRRRGARYAPRMLDLDLLDYEGRVGPGPPELPHPRLGERLFVLFPLRDVAPNWHHPISGLDAAEMIAHLPKNAAVPERL